MYAATKRPLMPRPLALPLKILPRKAHGHILSAILNQLFRNERCEGEFDFLEGRVVHIKVSDAELSYALTLTNGAIAEAGDKAAELTITGTVYDYLLLISGREDPDTLFFQRYLVMEGDTGLGVHLKNMLAAVEMEQLPMPKDLRPFIERCLTIYERFHYAP
ncbi:MAG: SCP2 sterol-binding domain-containing protein [Candidatus Thiodiazotropha sp. (ex Epidulcina cf. delphinae)]|nr:SCP2 sterol-binding domain-containing protein [Candidatus Thiodiazotropha sp. (ex Epidulcina cf. delphinae)]